MAELLRQCRLRGVAGLAAISLTVLIMPVLSGVLCSHSAVAGELPGPVTDVIGLELIYFPPGEYVRGAMHGNQLRRNHPLSTGGVGSHDARPAHRVKLTQPFRIAATEVTVGQFRQFVTEAGYTTTAETGERGSLAFRPAAERGIDQFAVDPKCNWRNPGFAQQDEHPVVCVSWKDAQAFCEWLSRKTGEKYRLPTEAEWEYAARAGSTTSYIGGDSPDTCYAYGNVADAALEAAHPGLTLRQRIARLGKGEGDGFVYTAPVARLKPNARGLYDTHGNVWEWCSDKYQAIYYRELTGATPNHGEPLRLPVIIDPRGPETTLQHQYGDWRAIRGGAWCTAPLSSRSAERSFAEAADASCYTGFRVVREVSE